MIVKVKVRTRRGKILVFYFRVKSDKTSLSFCQAVKKKRKGKNIYVCKKRPGWQIVQIVNIDAYIGGSLIQFIHDNKQMWGLVNGIGQITCFGYPHELTYFINRMFINYLIKSQLIVRGYTVISYKLYWLGKWVSERELPGSPDSWLIPTWIPIVQRRIIYRVVMYCQVVHVEYIGPREDEGIMTITIWIGRKVMRFKVRIDTVYIYWCHWSKKKNRCIWKKVRLEKIYKYIGLSIVRWQAISKQWITGLVNANGDIIAFAAGSVMEFYQLTVNRLFLQHLMIKYAIKKAKIITRYQIRWQGQVIVDIRISKKVKIDVNELLIPKWLPDDQCRVVWKVVKYESRTVVIYVGGEVSGPILTECIKNEDGKDCEIVDSTELDIDVPSIVFPQIIPVPENCERFNENGRCVDLINPDGYCHCSELCTCMDPFDYFKRKYFDRDYGNFDPVFPGSLIPAGIIPGSCVSSGVGYGCGPGLHPPQLLPPGAAVIKEALPFSLDHGQAGPPPNKILG